MVDGRDNTWRNRAPGPHAHRNTARQAMDGLWTEARGRQKQSNDPGNNQHNPQYANYWAPLTHKRHPPHPAQPRHTNDWAPRTRKRHQQEHRPQRPTERSDPTQHAKGRTGDCPGPRKGATTRRNVTQGVGGGGYGRFVDRGAWMAKTVKRPRQQPAQPQYANYWAPLTRKRHTMPHPAQPRHTNHWAPRTRKQHQQEHRPQRLPEHSDPTQHAKGRTGDCPGPRKETTTRRNVTRAGGGGLTPPPAPGFQSGKK